MPFVPNITAPQMPNNVSLPDIAVHRTLGNEKMLPGGTANMTAMTANQKPTSNLPSSSNQIFQVSYVTLCPFPEHNGPMKTKFRLSSVLLTLLILIGCGKTVATAPDVTFTTLTNQKIALKDLRGKPVLVTFWATDCPACIKEIPDLINLYNQYHASGLEMVAVTMYYDPPSHVVEMAKIKQLPYPVALDLTSELSRAFGGILFTPSTFLIAPDGSVIKNEIGIFDLANMKTTLEALLKG